MGVGEMQAACSDLIVRSTVSVASHHPATIARGHEWAGIIDLCVCVCVCEYVSVSVCVCVTHSHRVRACVCVWIRANLHTYAQAHRGLSATARSETVSRAVRVV